MKTFIGLCASAFLIGWLGLCTGCAFRVTVTPITAEEITQRSVTNDLYDYLFKTKEKTQ